MRAGDDGVHMTQPTQLLQLQGHDPPHNLPEWQGQNFGGWGCKWHVASGGGGGRGESLGWNWTLFDSVFCNHLLLTDFLDFPQLLPNSTHNPD